MAQLQDKVAIITGATGGIGGATAAAFLEAGARLMLVGRDAGRLDACTAKLGGGDRVAACVADSSGEADVARCVAETRDRFGRLDILFANAGAEGPVKPLTALSVAEFDHVQQVNVRGSWLAIKHGAPAMIESGGGSIVLTGSVVSAVGVAGLAAYSASKHAILGLARVAALELATSGVRVNVVAPAPIDNDMMKSIERQAAPDNPAAARAGFSALIAMQRYGRNEEVARLVRFLASDEASYCTGALYPVDGGFLAA